ncbi:MAG: glycoside hydrolase family 97 protein, partial [Gammaproteobacteria bacterium]|nr:glycoside hydrolase family 97 protein [Gammaproteobacteria bacterium]
MIKNGISTLLFISVFFVNGHVFAKKQAISSPDNKLTITISDNAGEAKYAVTFNGQKVIQDSRLGILFKNQKGFAQPLILGSVTRKSVDHTWEQPWGERQFVSDHHNELLVSFLSEEGKSIPVNIRFKAFNDGFGFRYEGTAENASKVFIVDEITEFVFSNAEKINSWWIPSRGWNRYEYPIRSTKLIHVDRAHTPFTFKLPSGVHMSIHEAALVDFAAMSLDQRRDGTLEADLAPRSDGIKVATHGGFKSSWRTVQITKDAVGLLNSNLILNLNEPNKLGDVSWVKPGKYIGIWWGMHLNVNTWGSGEKHGATTERTKEYMDFAAKYGFDGVLVEGWNKGWDGEWFSNGDVFNFTQSYSDFDLAVVTEYGKKSGVRLIGHHETSGSISNYENQMTDAYRLYAKHGVTQIKTGYVADGGDAKRIDSKGIVRKAWHDSQHMVNHYLKTIKEAAKYKLSINTHEPIKDTGLRRT